MPDFNDRVRTEDNERLGRTDFDAIAELFDYAQSKALGSLYGVSEGVLSRSETSFAIVGPEHRITLGACDLYGCKPTTSPSNIGEEVNGRYDPTSPSQIQTYVDVAAYEGGTCAIWWSLSLVPTDLDNRRQYQPGFPQGRAIAMYVRSRQRVTFQVTANLVTPPASGTWYRFAAVNYESVSPIVALCHAIDDGFEAVAHLVAAGTLSADLFLGQRMLNNRNASNNTGRNYGFARAITTLSQDTLKTLDSDTLTNAQTAVFDNPPVVNFPTPGTPGTYQLDQRMLTAEGQIAALAAAGPVLFWAYQAADGTILSTGGPLASLVTSAVRTSTGQYDWTFSASVWATGGPFLPLAVRTTLTGGNGIADATFPGTGSLRVFTSDGTSLEDAIHKVIVVGPTPLP